MRELYRKYERHFTTTAFIAGFIFDNLTIQQIDRWFEHLVLVLYLCFSALAIIVYNSFDIERQRASYFGRTAGKAVRWLPVLIQFSFGAVFSGSLVFYSRSASLSVSWPFLAMLIVFAVGNEIVRSRYGRFAFQLSALFVASFFYASFAIPVLIKSIGVVSFILSGLASLVFVMIVGRIIKWTFPERFAKSRAMIWVSIISLYAMFNVLYFTNLIPPLPLALKEIGIYHMVSRSDSGDYVLRYESAPWYYFRTVSPTFHTGNGNLAYAYSSVFAPMEFSTKLIHEWFYRDEARKWILAEKVSFPIIGGRSEGYRGYTTKNVFPGKWRVDVKVPNGSTVGRTVFTVVSGEYPKLETILR